GRRLVECRLNWDTIKSTASLLSIVSLGDVLNVEEVDPQYESALTVCSAGGLTGAISFFLVALSAYRLRCTGEEFWKRFAQHYLEVGRFLGPVNAALNYVLRDNCSSFLREVKADRIRKLSSYSAMIGELIYSCDFRKLWGLTSSVLKSDPSSKTVVFAVKMAYYCGRALKRCNGPLPADIPIPVDIRVARATVNLGIIPGLPAEEVLSKCKNEVIEAWRIIGEETGIPPIHLDTLIWALQNPSTLSKALARVSSSRSAEALRKLMNAVQGSSSMK
ncbi:MAG: N-glycosylase/DNA lyase, partial [Sulfolobales archaeon]